MWEKSKRLSRSRAPAVEQGATRLAKHGSAELTRSDKETADEFAARLDAVGSPPQPSTRNRAAARHLDRITAGLDLSGLDDCLGGAADMDELAAALGTCKVGGAAGEDTVSYDAIKHAHQDWRVLLLRLYNKVIATGIVPSAWGSASVSMLAKPGKDATDWTGYRGISLCSCISKVFEKIVQRRLTAHMEARGVLHHSQYGFRKGHSVSDAQLLMASASGMGLLPNESKRLGKKWACFIDQRRAFPSVPRSHMLAALHDHAHVGGRLFRCIANMYQNLTSHVCVGAARSASYTVDAGVREGSCLSATLYALFIDPLLWQLEESGVGSRVSVGEAGASVYAGAICYADDLCLCADSELELQKLMDIVGAFTVERETFTAREKTSVLCFGADADTPLRKKAWTMRGLHKPPASDGGTRWDDFVEEKTQYVHLGVTLDSSRSWSPHLEACEAHYVGVSAQGLVHRGIGAFGFGGAAGAAVWSAVGAPCLDKACEVTAACNVATNSALLAPVRKCWKAAVHAAIGGRGSKGTATTGIERVTGFRRTEFRREEALAKAVARWLAMPRDRVQRQLVDACFTHNCMGAQWRKAAVDACEKARFSPLLPATMGPKADRNRRISKAVRAAQDKAADGTDRDKSVAVLRRLRPHACAPRARRRPRARRHMLRRRLHCVAAADLQHPAATWSGAQREGRIPHVRGGLPSATVRGAARRRSPPAR